MAYLTEVIPAVRESVAAILRVRVVETETEQDGQVRPARIQGQLAGSGFCVVANRYLVTAFHVLNGGQPRDERDKFYAFVVPENGDPAFHFPVVGFPVERPDVDIAVLEVGPCASAGVVLPALGVSFAARPDGTRVVTVGYPAPEIVELRVGAEGNYMGGRFFLKSHANEGIVSAHYRVGEVAVYEFNVGWHHGESGGPVVDAGDPPVAFTLMQHYRDIQSPHGVVAGPHRGCALSVVERELTELGVVGL